MYRILVVDNEPYVVDWIAFLIETKSRQEVDVCRAVREAIVPDLDEANLKAVEYLEAVEEELGEAPEITPQGGGQFEDILTRACEDMLFGTLTPAEAGQRVLDDLAGALG